MKKIPYGIINYQELIEQNYHYVDKTMYLEKLEDVGKTLFYLRPGRFGKSLFTSMMFYYYDVNSEKLFNHLFKDTYVYQNPTEGKNNYHILKFDFSGISENKEENDLRKSFRKCVITGIDDFIQNYHISYDYNKEEDADDIIRSFLQYLKGLNLEHKIYIIIDEYDNFTNAILEGNAEQFKDIVGGIVKSFYANIKIYVKEGIVGRFFATGICPITLDSMTTGFNIASDISNDLEFNSMIGLTHEEVKELLNDVVLGKDREKIYQLMIENYDGYLFHKDANERVFNATLVMYLLNYYQRYQSIPESLMDKNIVSNYGKIGNLLKLQNNAYYEEILEQLLKEGMVIGELNNNFNLLVPFTEDDIISLLYYFGYLTIKEEGFGSNIYFQIPNKVMQKVYGNYFLQLLNDNNITISSTVIDEIIREIALEGKVSQATQNVSEILKQVDNRILIKFDEKYIQIMYFILLQGAKEFNLWTEYPSKNGYIDLYIEGNPKYMKQNIIIEFKYIKVSDRSEELLEEKIKEAREQIKRYSEDERLHQPLQKYIIIFSGSECLYIENVK